MEANNGIISSWATGITSKTMADFIDEIFRLIDANYKPVVTDYVQFPVVAAAMLARCASVDETAKVMGGNFLRVFGEAAFQ